MTIPLRILILEDRPSDAELILAQLKKEGFNLASQRVDTRADFLAALSAPFDLLLADHSLPGFSGLDAIRLLKERGLDIPAILISGAIGEDEAVMAIKEGAHDYLLKRKLTRLGSAVRNALEEKRLRDGERAAMQALRESETRFRSLVENSSDEISIIAADGALLYESPSANPTLGYRTGEFLGKSLFQLIHPDDLERVQGQFAQLVGNPDFHPREQFRMLHRDGTWRWIEAVGTNLLNEPSVRGIVVNYHDVTERKRAEEELETYARQQAALFRLSSDLAAVLEEAEVCQTIVRALHATLGYDYLGLFLVDKSNGERVLRAKMGWPSAPANWRIPPGQGVSEYAVLSGQLHYTPDVRRDPRYIPGQGTGAEVDAPIKIGDQVVGVLIAESNQPDAFDQQDFEVLTAAANQTSLALQRAREHQAVKEAEVLYRNLFNTVPVGIYQTTLEGRWLAANPMLALTLGYGSPEELMEDMADLNRQFYVEPGRRAEFIHLIREQGRVLDFESQGYRKDGSVMRVSERAQGIHDATGQLIGFEGTTVDITERKRAEEAQRQAEARFRNIVERLPGIAYIAEFGESGAWHYVSQQIEHILGFSPEEWTAQPDLWIRQMHPDDREKVIAEETEDWKKGVSSPEAPEYRLFARDGSTIWVRDEAHLILDDSGQPMLWQGVMYDITERKRAEEQIQRQLERLTALREIDRFIASSFDSRLTLNFLVSQVTANLRVDAAAVLLLDPHTNILAYAAGYGFRRDGITALRLRLGEDYAGEVALKRRPVSIPNLAMAERSSTKAELIAGENFVAFHAVPLVAKGVVKGVLEIFHRAPLHPDAEWLDFLETLAGQAAIAIDNSDLFASLQYSNVELFQAYDATIEGWSRAMDLRDKETEGHTQRVTEMTFTLAKAMGIRDENLVHIRRGALLHDIGKMGVPDYILFKADKLSDEEWEAMRRHPAYAYEMLSSIAYLKPALDIPYCHHEKWDGTGYPRGLKGEEIPLAARIFAVADVWDALTSDRPYRKAWARKKVIQYIEEQNGKHFDPHVVEVFLRLIGNE